MTPLHNPDVPNNPTDRQLAMYHNQMTSFRAGQILRSIVFDDDMPLPGSQKYDTLSSHAASDGSDKIIHWIDHHDKQQIAANQALLALEQQDNRAAHLAWDFHVCGLSIAELAGEQSLSYRQIANILLFANQVICDAFDRNF